VINQCEYAPLMPASPFTFSILVTSPIRRDLKFSPVNAMIFPLASIKLHFASLIIVGLDVLMAFLFKRSLAHPPNQARPNSTLYPVTLTLEQLNKLVQSAIKGQFPIPSPVSSVQPVPGQGFGPVGPDQPLFPDNLSVSLFIAAPFAPFDGSPDTSFTVPLFEIPGSPGNLVIALASIIAQFFIERAGVGTPNGTGNGGNNNNAISISTP